MTGTRRGKTTSDGAMQLPLEYDGQAPEPRQGTTNFVGNMQLPIHRWFRYSAGFSAEWVESLLVDRPADTRVLDPFAGSGTTLIASQQAGYESLGWDSHPFVSRVAAAKLCWTADVARYEELVDAVAAESTTTTEQDVSHLPALLQKCYTEEALTRLLAIRDNVLARDLSSPEGQLLWLTLVAIIRPTSHVGTAQWQYVLPNKRKRSTVEPLEGWRIQAKSMSDDMRVAQAACTAPPPASYRRHDVRTPDTSVPDGWATHVICSPPYANNYDYADATRLEQTVLGEIESWSDLKPIRNRLMRSCTQHMTGYDPDEALADPVLKPIIGELQDVHDRLDAKRHLHGGKKAYHRMIVAYFHDLAYAWRSIRRASARDSEVCFVIGDSAPYGIHVPVEQWLGKLAVDAGFDSWSFEKLRDRNVKWKNRKHDVPLHEGRLWVRG